MENHKFYENPVVIKVGSIAFIIGITLATIVGIYVGKTQEPVSTIITSILVILGFVIGLINITDKETLPFYASMAVLFLLATSIGSQIISRVAIFGPYLGGILDTMMFLFIPATIIVALKAVWDYAVRV